MELLHTRYYYTWAGGTHANNWKVAAKEEEDAHAITNIMQKKEEEEGGETEEVEVVVVPMGLWKWQSVVKEQGAGPRSSPSNPRTLLPKMASSSPTRTGGRDDSKTRSFSIEALIRERMEELTIVPRWMPPDKEGDNEDEIFQGLLEGVECRLETRELWRRFFDLGTEMIITKTGRWEGYFY